eukprot:TRINITY_DN68156_c5_g1_i6.p1 TRINITY_DN68156_c5_g1~~TRINITY_DN68156_c5_g1_i6.p1  ORF type:complete len:484 (-),score=84.70 TRINITY_DN68156_c5_g1_i6:121-1572(-)
MPVKPRKKQALTVDAAALDIASVDWNSLETKFQELNGLLNAPSYGLNASLARQKQKQQVEQAIETLLEMAQAESRRLLVEGDAQAAVEGGLRTLKLKEAYYGTGSLQLVPSYFHLARTNQYLDKFKQAEEFLSLAQWTILRHPECDVALKAELHQTFGLLYASDGKLDIALKQLAQATYYLTLLNGPNHILTSFGYFDLGNVFAAKSNMDSAMAYYEKVKDIWFTHLEKVVVKATQKKRRQIDHGEDDDEEVVEHSNPASFGEENLQDGLKMIRGIVGLQTERFGLVHPSTGRAELILALYHRWIGDVTHAEESIERALEIHKRVYGAQHQHTVKVKQFMMDLGYEIPTNTATSLLTSPYGQQPQKEQEEVLQPVGETTILKEERKAAEEQQKERELQQKQQQEQPATSQEQQQLVAGVPPLADEAEEAATAQQAEEPPTEQPADAAAEQPPKEAAQEVPPSEEAAADEVQVEEVPEGKEAAE